MEECESRVQKLLKTNIDKLKRVADALIEREVLDADELNKLLNGDTLPVNEGSRKNGKMQKN